MALAVGFTLLYLSTPTRHYTFDAVAYAYQIDRYADDGRPGWLFHAHHLLFNAAGWSVWVALQELGLQVSSLEALQVMNAVLGGIGVGLFALALARATGWPLLAVGLAALLGVSHGYWTCATDGRVNIPGLVGVLAAFGAALQWVESGSRRWALASGVLTGTAILFHQSHVLFVPVLGLAALLARAPWPRRLGSGLLAAMGVAMVVASGYLTVAVLVKDVCDAAGLQAWLWQYGEDGRWWSPDWRSNLPLSAAALARAAWPISGETAGQRLSAGWWSQDLVRFEGPFVWVSWMGGFLLLVRLPSLLRRHGAALLLCGVWFGVYGAFFTIWNPGYFPFWLPQLAAAGVALGLIAAGLLPDGDSEPRRRQDRAPAPAGRPGTPWARGWAMPGGRPIGQWLIGSRDGFRAQVGSRGRLRRRLLRPSSALLPLRCRARLLDGAARLRWSRLRRAGRRGQGRSIRPAARFLRGAPLLFDRRLQPARPQVATGSALSSWTAAARIVLGAVAAGVGLVLTFTLFFKTYGAAIRPRMEAEANPYLRLADTVREATQPGDLILATGAGWLAEGEVYIPYFSERPLLAVQAVLKREQGNKEAAFAYLRDYMKRCWSRGSRVFILDEALESEEAYEVLWDRYGLSREEARHFFEIYAPRPVEQVGVHSVLRLSPPASSGDTVAVGPRPVRTRVMGMRQRSDEGEAAPELCGESVEATTREDGNSDEAPGTEGDGPVSANGALAGQAAG